MSFLQKWNEVGSVFFRIISSYYKLSKSTCFGSYVTPWCHPHRSKDTEVSHERNKQCGWKDDADTKLVVQLAAHPDMLWPY